MTISMEAILAEAVNAGASDVHITAGSPPKMRVGGRLADMSYPRLFPADTLALFISIMTQTQRTLFEERGEYDMAFDIRELGRFRVSAYKQKGSVAMALRIIGTCIPSPADLGIPESVMELYRKQRGLILVAGPAGSGKSTTLAAMIDRINSMREANIITLEDPIEYVHQHKRSIVNQREVGLDCGSYASALRAALREDPDVIMAAELLDSETLSAAVTAAETGHLVLSSIHTSGAADTVDRMIDLFPLHQQEKMRLRIANVLEAVISQRLLPDHEKNGRKADFQVMHVTEPVRERIREGKLEQLPACRETKEG